MSTNCPLFCCCLLSTELGMSTLQRHHDRVAKVILQKKTLGFANTVSHPCRVALLQQRTLRCNACIINSLWVQKPSIPAAVGSAWRTADGGPGLDRVPTGRVAKQPSVTLAFQAIVIKCPKKEICKHGQTKFYVIQWKKETRV